MQMTPSYAMTRREHLRSITLAGLGVSERLVVFNKVENSHLSIPDGISSGGEEGLRALDGHQLRLSGGCGVVSAGS